MGLRRACCSSRKPPPERGTDRNGFTLMEMLVAVTILVTVVGVVYASFQAAVRAWRQQEARNYYNQNARQAWRELSRDLRCSFAAPINDSIRFTGGSQPEGSVLKFVTSLPGTTSGKGGLALVEYRVDNDPATPEQGLVKTDYGFPFPKADEQGGRKREIAPLVRSLKLEYFDGKTWLDEWGAKKPGQPPLQDKTLPFAVRITVRVAEQENRADEENITTVVPVFASDMSRIGKS